MLLWDARAQCSRLNEGPGKPYGWRAVDPPPLLPYPPITHLFHFSRVPIFRSKFFFGTFGVEGLFLCPVPSWWWGGLDPPPPSRSHTALTVTVLFLREGQKGSICMCARALKYIDDKWLDKRINGCMQCCINKQVLHKQTHRQTQTYADPTTHV